MDFANLFSHPDKPEFVVPPSTQPAEKPARPDLPAADSPLTLPSPPAST
jgi:hypothetical protein